MVPRVYWPRSAYCLLLGLALLWGQVRGECERRIPNCVGICVEKVECLNGRCGADGACDCLPCYSGPACASYDDKYGPRFAIPSDTVIINARHEGVVYKATAEDEDLGLTCPLGPGQHTRCPCAAITYSLGHHPDASSHPLFTIHDSSGQVFLREGTRLTAGSQYNLVIVASSTNNSLRHDYQTLTVVVHREDHLDDLLQEGPGSHLFGEDTEVWKTVGYNTSQFVTSADSSLEDGYDSKQLESLTRRKRAPISDTVNDFASLAVNVTCLTSKPTDGIIRGGVTLEYETVIILPQISNAMQLIVEVFAMDPVSGNTAFAICDVEVTHIGSKIQTDSGEALTAEMVNINMMPSVDFSYVNDRALVNFNKILNTDTGTGDDYTDSTIKIRFTATLIINPSYTNTSALLTIGAQYDEDNYVFVGGDQMNYDMTTPVTYLPQVTLPSPPTTVKQYGGATVILDTYINIPNAELLLRVSIPSVTGYDTFSISNIGISFMGISFDCSGPSKITYYPSVTGLTNIMAEYSMGLLTKNIQYPLVDGDYHGNAAFNIKFYFNVFALDPEVGNTVDVNVGLVIGTYFTYDDTVTLSVTAGDIPPVASGSVLSWSALEEVTPTTVEAGQAVTWASTMTLSSPANVEVECTLTVDSGNKVCGIAYGKTGANIANLPDLSRHSVFTAESVTFKLFFNSTGQVDKSDDAGADDVQFEFSVTVNEASATVSIGCTPGALSEIPVAMSTAGNDTTTTDVRAWVDPITPDDTNWYVGSQAGLLLRLAFPAGGTGYNDVIIEAVGDMDKTTWGSRACGARVVYVGKAVPCVAGGQFAINNAVERIDSMIGRNFTDVAKVTMGPACGTDRAVEDVELEVAIELYFDMPAGQTDFTAGAYNQSTGVNLDSNLIWTGWENSYTLVETPPTYTASDILHFDFLTDSVPTTDMEPGVPHVIQVLLRTKPQSAMHYKIKAVVDNIQFLSLCRIVILAVGDNFPCLDREFYDKENEPYQTTFITHDAEWGLSAELDLGLLKNLGNNTYIVGGLPDENSIVVGVVMKGVVQGSGTLTVTLDSSGTTTPIGPQALNVAAALTPESSATITSITPEAVDGTSDVYEGVLKMVDFVVDVPEGYKNTLKATITNTAVADFTVCFGAVVAVGKNLPCIIPGQINGNMTVVTETQEVYEVDVKEVCYFPFTENTTENQFTLRIGVMFLPGGGSAGTLSLVMQEGGSDLTPSTFAMTKLTTDFTSIDVNETGMAVQPLNGTDTVTPGMQFWTGVVLTVPRDITTVVEFGIMTTTDGGRAYATVHDFRIPEESKGKNIGCLLDQSMYSRILTQNSSHTTPMIHESQTDTLVIDLRTITNTGMTYIQKAEKPEDDQLHMEALILIADHPNATDGATLNVHFAVKTDNAVYVCTKSLTLDKTGLPQFVTTKELVLTDNTTTVFSQSDTVELTMRVRHLLNESTQEVNDACVRVFMPKYLKYVEGVDTFTSNVTGSLTNQGYLDYCFDHLFFTDNLEANFTLSVDPDQEIPPGLGQVKATTLLRLLGSSTTNPTPIKYIGKTAYVVYDVVVNDRTDPLNLATMDDCQFSALAAMDETTKPEMAKPGSGGGWSPPVTVGMSWNHYIQVDFLKKTRVTRIAFEEVAGKFSVKKFRLQYSQSGVFFSDECEVEVPANGEVDLPSDCRFNARYFRLVVLAVSDGLGGAVVSQETKPLGVRFTDWYGTADLGGTPASCPATTKPTRLSNDVTQWRHVAYDSTNDVFYFCDMMERPDRKGFEIGCYSSSDGVSWIVLPSYIGRLLGQHPDRGMCAMDKRDSALVCSKDGKEWSLMPDADHTDIKSQAMPPTVVPGVPSADLAPITFGDWSVDFSGVMKSGSVRARWANCCG